MTTWSAPAAAGELGLLRAAHGRDDGRAGPAGELDRRVADGAGAALDQDRRPVSAPGSEPVGHRLAEGEAAVRGQRRDAEARAEVEATRSRAAAPPAARGTTTPAAVPPRPLPGRLPQPDPLADGGRVDAVADRVDHPGAVLVRGSKPAGIGVGAPGLPVGRVHAGDRHPDPDLAGPGLGHLAVDQLEDVRVTVARVDDCLHGLVPTPSYPPSTTADEDRHMDAYVVTGGGRGVGRAIVERLLGGRDGGGGRARPGRARLGRRVRRVTAAVVGDAADEAVRPRRRTLAESAGRLAGWVNNAAVFRDAPLPTTPAPEVLATIERNLPRRWPAARSRSAGSWPPAPPGRSSTCRRTRPPRPVPGCAAVRDREGGDRGTDPRARGRATARPGIRVNAVALGTVATGAVHRAAADGRRPAAARLEREMAELHPLGRVGPAGRDGHGGGVPALRRGQLPDRGDAADGRRPDDPRPRAAAQRARSDHELVVLPVELGHLLRGRLPAGGGQLGQALEVRLPRRARGEQHQHRGRLAGLVAERRGCRPAARSWKSPGSRRPTACRRRAGRCRTARRTTR